MTQRGAATASADDGDAVWPSAAGSEACSLPGRHPIAGDGLGGDATASSAGTRHDRRCRVAALNFGYMNCGSGARSGVKHNVKLQWVTGINRVHGPD